MKINLRDYQRNALDSVRRSYVSGKKSPLLVIPTGGGKTIIMGSIAETTHAKGKKVIILVHRHELMLQTAEKLSWFGIECGMISPKFTPRYDLPVQVAMVQSLPKRMHLYPWFDLIITDECHHVTASTYLKVINNYPHAFQLGLTATPVRSDGKGLGIHAHGVYDDIVIGPTIRQLIEKGFLVEPSLYVPPSNLDMSSVGKVAGDYNRKKSYEAVSGSNIHGSAIDHYRELLDGKPAVAFCINIAHAQKVAEDFRAAGYRAFAVSGKTDATERAKILAGLGDGHSQVVASCDVISEGTDIPAIAGAMLLRPTQSLSLYLQQVGRTLRPYEGKKEAIILDHVGNCMRHGLVDQDRDWTLDGVMTRDKDPGEKEVKVALCKECLKAYEWNMLACPYCGKEREINVKKMKDVKVVEGKLVKVTAADKARIKRELRMEVNAARTVSELEKIAKQRKYKDGWVDYMIKSRKK